MLRRKGVTASVICMDLNVIRSHYLFKENFSTLNSSQTRTSNHYQVLGINQHASQEEIKKAFFTLSKKYHPDMLGSNSGDYSTQKFLQIREAYDTLRDEQKRRIYDRKFTENWTIRAAANPHLNKNRPENDYFSARGPNANIRYRNETSWQRNWRRQEEEQIKQGQTHTHWWTDYQKGLDEMWERESRGWRWRKNKRTLSALFYALAIMGIYYLLNRMLRID